MIESHAAPEERQQVSSLVSRFETTGRDFGGPSGPGANTGIKYPGEQREKERACVPLSLR